MIIETIKRYTFELPKEYLAFDELMCECENEGDRIISIKQNPDKISVTVENVALRDTSWI